MCRLEVCLAERINYNCWEVVDENADMSFGEYKKNSMHFYWRITVFYRVVFNATFKPISKEAEDIKKTRLSESGF